MCVGGIGDLKDAKFYVACFAEFLGTLILVFVGCGSCGADWQLRYEPSVVQIFLAFGLSVATIVWMIAGVSGGHINPAVTVAMLIARRISIARALEYIIAQCLGAIVGAAILDGVTPPEVKSNLGLTLVSDSFPLNSFQGFVVELIITFVLVTTVFATCDAHRKDLHGSGPLAIGLSVTMCHLSAVGDFVQSSKRFQIIFVRILSFNEKSFKNKLA